MKVDIFITESEYAALKDYLEYRHKTRGTNGCDKCPDGIYDPTRCSKARTDTCVERRARLNTEKGLYDKAASMVENPAFKDVINAYFEMCKARDELNKAQNAANNAINYFNAKMSAITIVEDEEDEH